MCGSPAEFIWIKLIIYVGLTLIHKVKNEYLASLDKWLDALSGCTDATLDNTRPLWNDLSLGRLGQWSVDVQLAKES